MAVLYLEERHVTHNVDTWPLREYRAGLAQQNIGRGEHFMVWRLAKLASVGFYSLSVNRVAYNPRCVAQQGST